MRPEPGETLGLVLAVTFLVVLVAAMVAAGTGTIDDLFLFVLGGELVDTLLTGAVVVVVVGLLGWAALRGGGAIRSATAHIHGGRRKTVIQHEAGHAAVAHGVGAVNIRARLKPGGGGEVTCDTSRMSPAEYVAFMRAGRAAAGASGDCLGDEANAKQELDCAPPDQRGRISREADRIINRYVHSTFGQKVARALDRDGQF